MEEKINQMLKELDNLFKLCDKRSKNISYPIYLGLEAYKEFEKAFRNFDSPMNQFFTK